MIVLNLIPNTLLNLFSPTEEMKEIGIRAIRLLSISLPLGGIGIVVSSFFQGLGLAKYSMYLSLARQIILLLPIVYLLSLTGSLELVWIGFSLAEGISLIVGYSLYKQANKKIIV